MSQIIKLVIHNLDYVQTSIYQFNFLYTIYA